MPFNGQHECSQGNRQKRSDRRQSKDDVHQGEGREEAAVEKNELRREEDLQKADSGCREDAGLDSVVKAGDFFSESDENSHWGNTHPGPVKEGG